MGELRVNRYLKNKSMDHIDHALGRPLDPMIETYRNHFATDTYGDLALEFYRSPHWAVTGAHSAMTFFSVTKAGREALRDHLKTIADPHRAFNVRYDGHTFPTVALTGGGARYSVFLDISDCRPDLTFKDFCKRARVSVASPKKRAAKALPEAP